jgi:ABC-type Fe3+/spermidine/putrescine transport system ATPase subunit
MSVLDGDCREPCVRREPCLVPSGKDVWPQPNDISAAAGTAMIRIARRVSFSGVEKRYSATDVALDGISFDIYPGEFVFLVGQSGSGKSTTMKLLIKEADATAGEIRVAGRDLQKIPRPRVPYYRRNLGVIFQDYKLLPDRTVYDASRWRARSSTTRRC